MKSKTPVSKDNLYINPKNTSRGGGASAKKIQIISPTAQATNQARESIKSNFLNQDQLQRIQRTIRKKNPQKSKKKRKNCGAKKGKATKKSNPKRKYKK